MTRNLFLFLIVYCMLCNTTVCAALSIQPQKIRDVPTPPPPELYSRRGAIDHLRHTSAAATAATLCTIISSKPSVSNAAVGGTLGLAAKLSQRDPAQLRNSVFKCPTKGTNISRVSTW